MSCSGFKNIFRSAILCCGAALAAGNIWPDDGSFESGHSLFLESAVKTDAYDGEYALFVPPEATSCGSRFATNILTPGPTYIFSAWVKSPVDFTAPVSLLTERYIHCAVGKMNLKANQWTRLEFHIDATCGRSIRFSIGKPAGQPMWIDAVKLSLRDEPGSREYSPTDDVVAGVFRANNSGDVVFTSEKPEMRLFRIRNNSKIAKKISGIVQLEAPELPAKELWKGDVELAPGQVFEKELQLLPETTPGYWVVRTIVKDETGKEYKSTRPFVVTPPPRETKDRFMGLHVWGAPRERYQRIGVKSGRDIIRWHANPFKDGMYQQTAEYRDFPHQLSMDIAHVPDHAAKNPDKSGTPEALEKYLRDYFRNTPDFIHRIDMENEPDLGWRFAGSLAENAKHYADYYKHFVKVLREVMPHAKIGGCGTAGNDFNANYPFMKVVAKIAGKEMDYFPIHPYAHARYIDSNHLDIGPEVNGTWEKTMEAWQIISPLGKNKEITFGEVGWALDVREDVLSDSAIRHAQYCSRLFLLAKALKVSELQWFLGDEHYEKSWYYYGMWRNNVPLPIAAAYAAVAQRLDGAKIVKVLENNAVYLFVFRDADNRLFLAGWTTDEIPVEVTLPFAPGTVESSDWLGRKMSAEGTGFHLTRSPRFWIALPGKDKEFMDALKKRFVNRIPLTITRKLLFKDRVAFHFANSGSKPFIGKVEYSGSTLNLDLPAPKATGWKIKPTEETLVFRTTDAGKAVNLRLTDVSGRTYIMPFRAEKLRPLKWNLPKMTSRDYVLPNDPNIGFDGPEDLSVDAEFDWDNEKLLLEFIVTDDVHDARQENFWAGDSVQIAIDTGSNGTVGFDQDDFEFTIAHTAAGKPGLECNYNPVGYEPEKLIKELKVKTSRKGNTTRYKIEIPWKAIGFTPQPKRIISLNFVVNDSDADGRGRAYWMGLTPGIGEGKTPGVYRKFILE